MNDSYRWRKSCGVNDKGSIRGGVWVPFFPSSAGLCGQKLHSEKISKKNLCHQQVTHSQVRHVARECLSDC